MSGIIAAQTNNPYGIIGAATGVELGMFRVFGCDGSSSDDVLISAFNSEWYLYADTREISPLPSVRGLVICCWFSQAHGNIESPEHASRSFIWQIETPTRIGLTNTCSGL